MKDAFQVHPLDNVATLLQDAESGLIQVLGSSSPRQIALLQPVALGHKVALTDLVHGAQVLKFGTPIGIATQPIACGEWVHLHNCRSALDERSSHFDAASGAAMDTPYE